MCGHSAAGRDFFAETWKDVLSIHHLSKQETSQSRKEFHETGSPGTIRTCDPLLRRQMLYPTELQADVGGYVLYDISSMKVDHWRPEDGPLTEPALKAKLQRLGYSVNRYV